MEDRIGNRFPSGFEFHESLAKSPGVLLASRITLLTLQLEFSPLFIHLFIYFGYSYSDFHFVSGGL